MRHQPSQPIIASLTEAETLRDEIATAEALEAIDRELAERGGGTLGAALTCALVAVPAVVAVFTLIAGEPQ